MGGIDWWHINLALQALGYDIADRPKALAAFRRHYRGIDRDTESDDEDGRLLTCLLAAKSGNARTPTMAILPLPSTNPD